MNYRVSVIEILSRKSAVFVENNFGCLSLRKYQTFSCFPLGIYLLKFNNGNSRTMCEICTVTNKDTIFISLTQFFFSSTSSYLRKIKIVIKATLYSYMYSLLAVAESMLLVLLWGCWIVPSVAS